MKSHNSIDNHMSDTQEELKKYRELVAFVAHELRNMVHGIYLLSSSLNIDWQNHDDTERKKISEKIVNLSKRMVDLSSQILDFSKFNSFTELNVSECKVGDLIFDIADEARTCHPMKENDIILKIELADHLDIAYWDANLIQQAFRNLLNNAYKFTDQGEITIMGTLENEVYSFIIRDTGRGFNNSDPALLFEQYVRGDNVNDKIGTGLGLAITKTIINAHGGSIKAERPQAKEGAEFIIQLPQNLQAKINKNKMNSNIIPVNSLNDGRVISCLLIDDDAINIQAFELIISQENSIMLDSILGNHLLLDNITNIHKKYDVIFLDLIMPHISTHEVIKTIQNNPALKDSKIIIQTGLVEGVEIDEAFKLGAKDKLIKPFSIQDVFRIIKNNTQG